MMHQMKFATSNLKKSAFATAINIIGLTTAFAAFILIMLYVWNEHQFDCFNEHNTEIYRLEIKSPLNPKTSVYMFGPTGKTLVDEFPEVLASTTYMPWGRWNEETFTWERNGNEIKSFENYAYSDEFLTDIFTFNIVNGKTIKPLLEPQTAMVSESFAKKAWKSADVVGKKLISGNSTYTISAVYADLEPNSVIQSPIILKMPETGWLAEAAKGWDVVNYPQFIKVKPGVDTEHLNSIINSQSIVREKYYFFNKGNVQAEIVARPLRDLHFTGESSETPMFTTNSLNFVNSLFWVGILILLVALINYVNFLTANVPGRIKSISITRIIGSSRLNSISIFIIETLLIFAISFIMALGSAWFVNQNFTESIIGYKLPHEYGLTTTIGVGVFLLALVAGLYPALYSTRGKPVETIKRFQSNTKINLRGVLTVFQFTATIALIALSTLIIKQIKFIETTNLGFNKYNTLVIRMNDELRKNFESFTNNLKSSPFIQDIACSRAIPGQAQEMTTFNIDGQQCQIWYWATDDNYIHMMDFELVEGRNFLKNSEAEIRNMICNETAAQKYGWTPGTKIGDGVLVGIIKDFNFISLREQVEAFSFWYTNDKNFFQYISLKVQPENIKEALLFVEKTYNQFSIQIPFRYFFLDDHLNMLYSKESQQVKLITFFTFLSIIVSVLGILGLSIFMCQHKIKEIGIRKVNGARISEVLVMLNRNFVKWVIIAFIVATPIAWYAMQLWLMSFTYKTELSWWIFALAGLLALGIALLTVSLQSYKAARKNPVESLRYE